MTPEQKRIAGLEEIILELLAAMEEARMGFGTRFSNRIRQRVRQNREAHRFLVKQAAKTPPSTPPAARPTPPVKEETPA